MTDAVTSMEAETKLTSRIVNNLLAFSRQSKIESGKVDINKQEKEREQDLACPLPMVLSGNMEGESK